MEIVEAATFLEDLNDDDIKAWAESINYSDNVSYFITNGKPAFKISNVQINSCRKANTEYYFVLNYEERSNYDILFFAQIEKSTSRNGLFKRGMHQSLIWKAPGYLYGSNFSVRFLAKLIDIKNELLMTDMKQTVYGRNMWIGMLRALYKNYDCYYALSAPSDAKCIIKIEDVGDITHYEKDIVKKGYPYAFTSAFILKKGLDPKNYLLDPDKTLILTCKEAEELDAFTTPKNLSSEQENQMWKEYERR